MRKTIFEQIKDKMSFSSEIKRLETLIKDENGIRIETPKSDFAMYQSDYKRTFCSLESFVDTFIFKLWKGRGTCIDCEDMRKSLRLSDIINSESPSLEEVVSYCEYVANLIKLHEKVKLSNGANIYKTDVLVAIVNNLNCIMDWLNLEMIYFDNEERVLIIEKSAAISAVAECLDDDLAFQVVKYNHHNLKGDISSKKAILLKMGNELESKRRQLSSINKELETNIFFMLNNFDLRHNNRIKEDRNYQEYIAMMETDELETWYDELYQMMLLATLELEQIERNKRIKDLKDNCKNEKRDQI